MEINFSFLLDLSILKQFSDRYYFVIDKKDYKYSILMEETILHIDV